LIQAAAAAMMLQKPAHVRLGRDYPMRLACLFPVVLLGACATAPKSPPTPAPESVAPAAAAAPAADAAPATATGAKFEQIDAANIAEAQAAGYKVVDDKGTTLLCRKDLITGTRLKYVTTCLTAMQWRENANAAREAVKPAPTAKPVRGN
jgi:hypothetical protein